MEACVGRAGAQTTPATNPLGIWVARWARRLRRHWLARPPRRLRLRETLSLGERRFVAVVEFEEQNFLIGGTSGAMTLLARLARNDGTTSGAESSAQGRAQSCAEKDSIAKRQRGDHDGREEGEL